jgi:rare lipoprotein A
MPCSQLCGLSLFELPAGPGRGCGSGVSEGPAGREPIPPQIISGSRECRDSVGERALKGTVTRTALVTWLAVGGVYWALALADGADAHLRHRSAEPRREAAGHQHAHHLTRRRRHHAGHGLAESWIRGGARAGGGLSRSAQLSGMASVYRGGTTASGERARASGLTAAHRSLPFGTMVRVTNRRNGRSVVVRINDRGPFVRDRVIDVTPAAARVLGFSGLAAVLLKVVEGRSL